MGEDLDDLAGAVGDGDSIDWRAARKRLTTPESRDVADNLRFLQQISGLKAAARRPTRRLPLSLEFASLVAAFCSISGLAGFFLPFEARRAVLMAVLSVFGGVALTLYVGGRDRRTRALAACFWTTAAAFAARGLTQLSFKWPGSVAIQVVASLRPEAFFAAAVWQFARDFPRVTRFAQVDAICQWGVRVALLIGFVLFAAGVVPLVVATPGLVLTPRSGRGLTAADLVFWLLVFSAALAGLMVIAWRGRLAQGGERARVRFFLYAVAFSFGPVVTQVVALVLLPAYLTWAQTPRGFFWSGLMVYPPMFVLPFATAYAVAARDVLGVRLVVQRSLRYLLARWFLLWGAGIPAGLLLIHLYRHSDQALSQVMTAQPAATLAWFAGVGVTVLAFRIPLIRALDAWALPGIEDPSAVLAEMSDRLKRLRTPLEVAVTLAEALERATQAPAVALLYVDGVLLPADGGPAPLPAESAIPALMEGARMPSPVSAHRGPYYPLLLETDRAWIDEHQIAIIVPVLAGRAESRLLGIVGLSARRNALGFSQDDLRFVHAASAAASLACDAIASDVLRANPDAAHGAEEVALQCLRCRRVEEWSSGTGLCACKGAWEPASLPKRVQSRFDLLEWIGRGGMGVVYRASDLVIGREVALKTLPVLSEHAADRLIEEARTMASLSHEDVAILYGVERWRGTPLLVMEYLPGGSLAARLRRGRLVEHDLLGIARQLLRSLARVHARGLYHGDIKPSNIGFTSDGAPKLLDFGLARALSTEASAGDGEASVRLPGVLGGTLPYLPPEIHEGAAPGPALDLWAFGVVLCEALLGAHPFPLARTRAAIVNGRTAALARLRAEHSAAHEYVIATALALDPADRPATAAEFEQLLTALA